jgi:acetyl-CoA acetyltransferase
MSGLYLARNQVAIVGYAHSQVVRRSTEPLGLTALRTARAAIADAGLTPDQIDGFASSSLMPTSGDHAAQDGISVVSSDWLAQHLGTEPKYVVGFQGIGQLTGSLTLAVNALASGAAVYNEYCQRYGATREAMAHVVVEARKNGARLPWSYWHDKPLSFDDYMSEPLINDPMSRLDCDIPVHGVGVFILTRADRAKDMPNKPVFISGYANAYPSHNRISLHWTLDDMMEAGKAQAARLWEKSGFTPGEIDLPQVYDAFSPYVYIWLESLGFCPEGEAHRFVMDGNIDSNRPGSLAVVSGGGALGNGRLHGVPQLLECYLQLAGRAGARQRAANTALFSYSAPNFGGSFVLTGDVS